ncbi:hypothetical protein N656DRAFT_391208 [Canariomyces notabilis]|uniref:Uncharacterized protein n=1 Tax=Canariomyces notabilis TaxID=2074819 RepID=A0AAN6TJQ3_9PEZI|nr:hypothetical protein N656DRAFT_391208 [Canariomyces arenarius]
MSACQNFSVYLPPATRPSDRDGRAWCYTRRQGQGCACLERKRKHFTRKCRGGASPRPSTHPPRRVGAQSLLLSSPIVRMTRQPLPWQPSQGGQSWVDQKQDIGEKNARKRRSWWRFHAFSCIWLPFWRGQDCFLDCSIERHKR